jgi:murein DD-endopeptidase MepM/ murein hydrolase activator NlpD
MVNNRGDSWMERDDSRHPLLLVGVTVLALLLASCAQAPDACPRPVPVDLSDAEAYALNEDLPFRFPLDDLDAYLSAEPFSCPFAAAGFAKRGPFVRRENHAAEDTLKPAGTPVYAMADGTVSFSGPMGGYGWLVIVDHPQANLYSLYGHLSPSRWRIDPGPVEKGELLGYLGDSDENGGSAENPLRTHLHFGVRLGQRADYSGEGAWRWQAGWIRRCPQDAGWLQPSLVITNQEIPAGGFPGPAGGFLARWWIELLLGAMYLVGGLFSLVFGIKRDKPLTLVLSGGISLAAGWFFYNDGWRMSYVLLGMGILIAALGLYGTIRRISESRVQLDLGR